MDNIRNWFTPANREKIYTAIAALAPILVTAGVLLPGHVEPIMAIVAAGLQAFGGILALSNLKPTDAARWFGTVGRGIIYGGAVSVAGAVVAMGIVTQDWATGALTYTSFGLTALASVLAIVTPKAAKVDLTDTPLPVEAVIVDNAVVIPETEAPITEIVATVETEPVLVTEPESVEEVPVISTVPVAAPVEDTGDGRDL